MHDLKLPLLSIGVTLNHAFGNLWWRASSDPIICITWRRACLSASAELLVNVLVYCLSSACLSVPLVIFMVCPCVYVCVWFNGPSDLK